MKLNNPRQIAREALIESIGREQWDKNKSLVDKIKYQISQHPIFNHPIIPLLAEGAYDKNKMANIHLEYRKAIVQVFTDALLMAQYQARQIEGKFYPGIKAVPRFLITLNILDEFGFRPGLDDNDYYKGNPEFAHYPLFEKVLDDYGVEQRENYVASDIAIKLEEFLMASFDDYMLVSALLAVAEQEVVLFSPVLKANTDAVGLETANGYYFFHGTTEDEDLEASDDDHEDDLWYLVTQVINEDNFQGLLEKCNQYCDLWYEFWDHQLAN